MSLISQKELINKKLYKFAYSDEYYNNNTESLPVLGLNVNKNFDEESTNLNFVEFKYLHGEINSLDESLEWVYEVTLLEDSNVLEQYNAYVYYTTDKYVLSNKVAIRDFFKGLDYYDLLKIVTQKGAALRYIDNQTEALQHVACACNGYALEFVDKQTDILCMIACAQNGNALQYVINKTYDICYIACAQNGSALQHVVDQTEELCKLACSQNYYALYHVKKQTLDICMEAYERGGTCALEFFNEEFLKYVDNC